MEKRFTKKVEDFTCEHCGVEVKGNGYTNHCFSCLWSKHVDKNPGDRLEICGGMMKPIQIEAEKGTFVIIHECVKCRTKKRNRISTNDSGEAMAQVQKVFANAKVLE